VKMQLMAARAGAGQPVLVEGNIVQLGIPEIDRGRAAGTSLTCVVVEVTPHDNYRLATRHGVLQVCYFRGDLVLITEGTLAGLNLEGAFANWKSLPRIPLRTAALKSSITGGQGMMKCGCRSTNCRTKRCKCFAANRQCNSRCHPSSSHCTNCE
jgi:hypothetical protein